MLLLEMDGHRVATRLRDVLVRHVLGGLHGLQAQDFGDALHVVQRAPDIVLPLGRRGLRDDERRIPGRRIHGGDRDPMLAGKAIGDVGGHGLQLLLTRAGCPGDAEISPIDLPAHRDSTPGSPPSARRPTADPDAPRLSGPASCAVGVERTAYFL